jgi:predicted peptidase
MGTAMSLALLLITAVYAGQSAGSGEPRSAKRAAPGRQTAHYAELGDGEEVRMGYWLYLPENYSRKNKQGYPLLLFLHGAGERGADLAAVKRHGPPSLIEGGRHLPFIVVSPQCPEWQFWKVPHLYQLLKEVMKRYRVDADRVYITGLSMGGFGTWAFALEHPELFAAALPVCGGGNRHMVRPANQQLTAELRRLPFWVFHGARDSVVPLSASEEMVEAVRAVGGTVRFTAYPEAGHDSWTATYDNPEVYRWLAEQRRSPAPNP